MVYFIQDGGTCLVKIGCVDGNDAAQRLRTLQVGCPSKLVLLGVIEGNRATEAALHSRFAAARERGEWFRPVPALIRCLMDLASGGEPTLTESTDDFGMPDSGEYDRVGRRQRAERMHDHLEDRVRPARLVEAAYRRGCQQALFMALTCLPWGVDLAAWLRCLERIVCQMRFSRQPYPLFLDKAIARAGRRFPVERRP